MSPQFNQPLPRNSQKQNIAGHAAYEAWLCRQRVYCARDFCYRRAVTVENFQGQDVCLCAEHAGRLDAARKSDRKQIPQ